MRVCLVGGACWLLMLAAPAMGESKSGQPSQALGASTQMEEVMVSGVQPGPGLWRVSKDDRTLWILGTYSPLPRQMTWRSKEVEATIAESQQVLAPYSAEFYITGTDSYALTGKKLQEILEPAVYARWRALRKRYIGREGRDDWLPASAAVQLQMRAFERAGLTFDDQVWRTVYRIAREHGVPVVTDHQIRHAIRPSATSDFASVYDEPAAIEFLTKTIERLERDIAATKARANAWAVGDVTALSSQLERHQVSAYMASLSGPFIEKNGLNDLFQRADTKWLQTATRALQNNKVTFAVLPMQVLVDADGLTAKLRIMGYEVEPPR
jgi:uncharacterized protein YbaP (TraB family)